MADGALRRSAIVLTPRSDLREAVELECKELGVEAPRFADDREQCISLLASERDTPLIIDWEVGANDCNAILGADRRSFKVETRPIFVVTSQYSTEIFAIAVDYAVSQMHAGPISRLAIKECLSGLFNEDDETRELRAVLVKVAECRQRNEWSEASTLIEKQLTEMPQQQRLVFELAEQKIHDMHWDEVATLLQPLIDKDPPDIRALHLYGRALMRQGNFDQAIQYLYKAKIINPLNVDRLIDLGNAFLSNNQVEEALIEFKSAKEIDPNNKDATIGESKCLLMDGEINEALLLLKSVSGPREIASIFNTAAVLSMRRTDFEKGMSLYRSALAALGEDKMIAARLHYNIGLGFRRWQKLELAAKHLKRSLELDSGFDKAKSHLDKILESLSASHLSSAATDAHESTQGSDVALSEVKPHIDQPPTKTSDTSNEQTADEATPAIDWEQSA